MLRKLVHIARYTILEAVRGRLPALVAILFMLFLGLSELAAQTTVTEGAALRSGLLAVLWRWSAILVMSLFVISSMLREFEDRCIQLALAMPLARSTYLLGRFIGFALIGWVLALVAGTGFLFGTPFMVVLQWSVSLGFELMIVIALSLLSVLTLGSVTAAACLVLGIYVLGRAMGAIQLIGHSDLVARPDTYLVFMRTLVDTVAYVLPRLDEFTRSQWLVYPSVDPGALGAIAAQSLIYTALALVCALFDLHRKSI